MRGVPIIWDAFISLYNTVVDDRKLFGRHHPAAYVLLGIEWLACRAANRIVLDTQEHARYFSETYSVPASRFSSVLVGVEPDYFPLLPEQAVFHPEKRLVLFYGQFIPLHGIETIINAARLLRDEAIDFVIIGSGQEEQRIRTMVEEIPLPRLTWIPWVSYADLSTWIARCDVCLGIFGNTDNASRVIPNKVFQAIMSGKTIITRDSPAIRELVAANDPGIHLVPAANPDALATAIRTVFNSPVPPALHAALRARITPTAVGHKLVMVIADATNERT